MGLYLLFTKGPKFDLLYNCTFYAVDDVSIEKRQHRVFSYIVFFLGVFFETIYIPCAYALSRKKLLQSNFCYKLMFLMTLYDMVLLAVTSLFPGYLSFYGYTYCSKPEFNLFFGSIIIAFWIGYSQTSIILAINRCLSFTHYKYIFDGYLQYVFMSIPLGFTFYVLMFGMSASYSPIYNAWFFDPHRGYYNDVVGKYGSDIQYWNNMFFIFVLPMIYVLFVFHMYVKSKGREGGMPKKEVALFVQTLIINFTIAGSALGYTLMQYFELPPEAIAVTHISWIIVEGTPPLVYLTVNQTIRKILQEGTQELSSWMGIKRVTPSVHAFSHSNISRTSQQRPSINPSINPVNNIA